MSLLPYRPVVSCGRALLPAPNATGLHEFPLHQGCHLRSLAFHPDQPWLAICQLIAGETEAGAAGPTIAVSLSAKTLRRLAAEMVEVANLLEVKPTRETKR